MTLTSLFQTARVRAGLLSGDAEISAISIDSRRVSPGTLFVCMPGTTNDSHGFIEDAHSRGASAVIVYSLDGMQKAESLGMARALLPGERLAFNEAIWRLCRTFFDRPTRSMKVIGVTGTNGKTTTAWLLRDMLAASGLRAAYLGTLGFHLPEEQRELSNTTPFAVDLYNLLAEARDRGVQALAMEVSSHSLAERRVDGIEFDAAVFTNLTQDHLDFHGTMEQYEAAKWRLFSDLPEESSKRFVGALNVDDAAIRARAASASFPCITYGQVSHVPEPLLCCVPLSVGVDRLRLRLSGFDEVVEADVPLGGNYNVENSLSAVAGMAAMGYPFRHAAALLSAVHPVPGRFEPVKNDKGIGVLVDYAHTPDALEKLLDAVRELGPRRIITVFGCGGDRDRGKRPKMARAASLRSDLTVVTSDNPRTEDPRSILDEVLTGIEPGRDSVAILDRREAISEAVRRAEPGDVVVIAGKGHENYQIIGRTKYPMDDREIAREALGI